MTSIMLHNLKIIITKEISNFESLYCQTFVQQILYLLT